MATNRLLKKLGLSTGKKYLIIHADDMGLCHAQNKGSIRALEEGSANSGSIMATCKCFDEIVQYSCNNKEVDFGVHLTLTAEWSNHKWGPVLPIKEVPSLVDQNGHFLGEDYFDTYDLQELENELCAQIEKIIDNGIQPTHLDCHMFCLFRHPEFMNLYIKLSRKYNIPPLISKDFFHYFNLNADSYNTNGIIFTNEIYIATPENVTNGMNHYYSNVINEIETGLNVILIHPAYNDNEMKKITGDTNDWGAAWRQNDLDFFTSDICEKLLSKNNIELITWKEINQLTHTS